MSTKYITCRKRWRGHQR